jgi:hypothetical protein
MDPENAIMDMKTNDDDNNNNNAIMMQQWKIKDPVAWKSAWYNTARTQQFPQKWFLHASPLFEMEHFHYMEKDGCRLGGTGKGKLVNLPPPTITVNVSHFVSFVASRFML